VFISRARRDQASFHTPGLEKSEILAEREMQVHKTLLIQKERLQGLFFTGEFAFIFERLFQRQQFPRRKPVPHNEGIKIQNIFRLKLFENQTGRR
jgi:hypothetical protein